MYVYAITDEPELPLPATPGLGGASLASLADRDVTAVVSSLETRHVQPMEAHLWHHEMVVEALMTDRTVLPVRFGTVLASEAAVMRALAVHYADFVAGLQRVRGKVELGLRVLWDHDPQPPTSQVSFPSSASPRSGKHDGERLSTESGRTYMLARLEEQRERRAWRQRAEELAARLHAPLARLAAESTHQLLLTPRLVLTAAYLIGHNQMAVFRQEVEALRRCYPSLRFLCTGPWPPYSFVGETALEIDAGPPLTRCNGPTAT